MRDVQDGLKTKEAEGGEGKVMFRQEDSLQRAQGQTDEWRTLRESEGVRLETAKAASAAEAGITC